MPHPSQISVFSMVLSSESPATNSAITSNNASSRPSDSARSGYILSEGQSPEESLVWRLIQEYILCGCICPGRPKDLTPELTRDEEEYLVELRKAINIAFDSKNADHEMLLASIWRNAFPGDAIPGPIDPQWKKLGFQSGNPRTDLRTGVHSLMAIEYMSRRYADEFRLIVRESGTHSSEYPFAASCVSLAFSLIVFFKLNNRTAVNPSGAPSGSRFALKQFVRLCMCDKECFNELFAHVAIRVHREWMKQEPSRFDIHYYAVASGRGMKAVAELFQSKRIRNASDFSQILI